PSRTVTTHIAQANRLAARGARVTRGGGVARGGGGCVDDRLADVGPCFAWVRLNRLQRRQGGGGVVMGKVPFSLSDDVMRVQRERPKIITTEQAPRPDSHQVLQCGLCGLN